MADLAKLKITVDSRDMKAAEKDMQRVERQSQKTEKATEKLEKAYRDLERELRDQKRKFNELERAYKKTEAATKTLATTAALVRGAFAALAAILAGVVIAKLVEFTKKVIDTADKFKVLQGRIANATKETGDYNKAFDELLRISNKTGTDLETTVQVFQRVAIGARDVGKSTEEILLFTEAVEKLGVVSGAGPEELKNGLRQLAQALSSGVVRAEEMNSVLENTPAIANEIGKAFGISAGQLRKLVVEGKITSEQFFDAVLKRVKEIDKQFNAFPITLARVKTAFSNNFTVVAGVMDESFRVTERLIGIYRQLNKILEFMATRQFKAFLGALSDVIDQQFRLMGLMLRLNPVVEASVRLFEIFTGVVIDFNDPLKAFTNFAMGAATALDIWNTNAQKVIITQEELAKGLSGNFSLDRLQNRLTGAQAELLIREGQRRVRINQLLNGSPDSQTGTTPKSSTSSSGSADQALQRRIALFKKTVARDLRIAEELNGLIKEGRDAIDSRKIALEAENAVLAIRNKEGKAFFATIVDGKEVLNTQGEELKRQIIFTKEINNLTERQLGIRQKLIESQQELLDIRAVRTFFQSDGVRGALDAQDDIDLNRQADSIFGFGKGGTQRFDFLDLQKRIQAEQRASEAEILSESINREAQQTRELAQARKEGVFALEELRRQQELSNQIREATIRLHGKEKQELTSSITARFQANEALRKANEFYSRQEALIQQAGNAFRTFIGSALSGTQNFRESLRQLLVTLAQVAIKLALLRSISGGAFGGPGGTFARLLGFSHGGVIQGGNVVPFAKGGTIVRQPSVFPMANGNIGLVGEAGRPEAVLPLERTSGGDLGVKASMGSGGAGVVIENFQVNVDRPGSPDQNQDLAERIREETIRALEQTIDDRIITQTRNGGVLNPGVAV